MATITGKQLAQARPANTTAVSLYSPAANVDARLTQIVICNTTAVAATFRLFHDDNGTTYDESTALYWDISVSGNDSVTLGLAAYMADDTGNFAIRTGTASALTFTLYGLEEA